jgi:hypothetical protein
MNEVHEKGVNESQSQLIVQSEMRSLLIFSLVLLVVNIKSAQSVLHFVQEPEPSTSTAISNVINKLFVESQVQYDIVIYGETTQHINNLANEVS